MDDYQDIHLILVIFYDTIKLVWIIYVDNLTKENIMGKSQDKGKDKGSKKKPKADKKK